MELKQNFTLEYDMKFMTFLQSIYITIIPAILNLYFKKNGANST